MATRTNWKLRAKLRPANQAARRAGGSTKRQALSVGKLKTTAIEINKWRPSKEWREKRRRRAAGEVVPG